MAEKKGSGKTIDEFKKLYDKDTIIPQKIEAAIKALGPDCWEYETEFLKRADISQYDMGNYRDRYNDDFVVTVGRHAKRVWAGSKVLKEKLEMMI